MKNSCILDNKIIMNKGMFNNIDLMENSIESFKETFNLNYVLRCKIQYLKDNNFIIFEDDTLERLFNLKDSIKNTTYDDLDYIAKYKIPTILDLLNIISNNNVILEIGITSKKVLKKLEPILSNYKNQIIIESTYIKTLNFFKKKNYITSLLIIKNKRLINSYFKPHIYNISINLFDKKIIKKLRENYYVIGNIIKDNNELKENKEIFDNLIIEGQ